MDGWRGISIILVIAGHLLNYRYMPQVYPGGIGHSPFRYQLIEALSVCGVCIFFCISGFIIIKLAMDEHAATGRFSAGAFYTRRFFRIIPPFYLYLLFVLVCGKAGWIAQAAGQTLHAPLFVCNMTGVDCGWFAACSWTLAYEEQFYLMLPLILLCAGGRIRVATASLLLVLLAIPVLWYPLHYGHRGFMLSHAAFDLSFICIGALWAAFGDITRELCTGRYAAHAAACALLSLALLLVLDAANRTGGFPHIVLRLRILVPLLEPLCVAWLIGYTVYQPSLFSRLVSWAPLTLIGTVSYSLYLWQQVFTAPPLAYLLRTPLLFPPLMLLCAILSYEFVERPCVRLAKQLLASRPAWRPFGPHTQGLPRP